MKRYLLIFSVLLCFLTAPNILTAQSNYVGLGLTYINPMSSFSEVNNGGIGYSAIFESRKYCKYWYGLRLDYYSTDSLEGKQASDHYFNRAIILSPEFRYNFIPDDCGKYDLTPYANALLSISSISNTDSLSTIGLGYGIGVGAAYSFTMFKKCWMLDLNALYGAPNALYAADGRKRINSLNVGLSLSVGL